MFIMVPTVEVFIFFFFAGFCCEGLPTPPASRALRALKNLGGVPPTPSIDNVTPPDGPDDRIPSFDVVAPGGRAKELTLGIRR